MQGLSAREPPRTSLERGTSVADGVGVRERSRNPRPAAVALLALAPVLAPVAPLVARAAVEDDRHIRVVLVVVDHLLVEVGFEVAGDDAVDHRSLSVGIRRRNAIASFSDASSRR